MHACMAWASARSMDMWRGARGIPPPAEGDAERKHKGLEEAEKAAGEWAESEGEGEGEEAETRPKRAKAGYGSKGQPRLRRGRRARRRRRPSLRLRPRASTRNDEPSL